MATINDEVDIDGIDSAVEAVNNAKSEEGGAEIEQVIAAYKPAVVSPQERFAP